MATSLEVKLRTAALATPALTSLLGTTPFRWFDMQQVQSAPFPSVTVLLVSAVNMYSTNQRLASTRCRVQFTVWDTNAEEARTVENAIIAFLDGFDAMNLVPGVAPTQANEVVMRRQGGNPQTSPLTFWRIIDAMIWNNEQT